MLMLQNFMKYKLCQGKVTLAGIATHWLARNVDSANEIVCYVMVI